MDITDNYSLGKVDGFDEAWKLAREIFNYDYSDSTREDIFGVYDLYSIFNLPAVEVATRIEEYKKKIKVGDVVKYGVYVGVVLEVHSKMFIILTKNSEGFVTTRRIPKDQATKLAESVDSFSDMLGKIGHINE